MDLEANKQTAGNRYQPDGNRWTTCPFATSKYLEMRCRPFSWEYALFSNYPNSYRSRNKISILFNRVEFSLNRFKPSEVER